MFNHRCNSISQNTEKHNRSPLKKLYSKCCNHKGIVFLFFVCFFASSINVMGVFIYPNTYLMFGCNIWCLVLVEKQFGNETSRCNVLYEHYLKVIVKLSIKRKLFKEIVVLCHPFYLCRSPMKEWEIFFLLCYWYSYCFISIF